MFAPVRCCAAPYAPQPSPAVLTPEAGRLGAARAPWQRPQLRACPVLTHTAPLPLQVHALARAAWGRRGGRCDTNGEKSRSPVGALSSIGGLVLVLALVLILALVLVPVLVGMCFAPKGACSLCLWYLVVAWGCVSVSTCYKPTTSPPPCLRPPSSCGCPKGPSSHAYSPHCRGEGRAPVVASSYPSSAPHPLPALPLPCLPPPIFPREHP